MPEGGVYSDVYKQDSPDSSGWKPLPESVTSSATKINTDPETLKNFDFTEESVRKAFIRKVYLILMGQLMVTLGVISLFIFHEPTKIYTQQHPYIFLLAFFGTLVIVISMACCESARRTFPTNFICLGLFTVAESILLGSFCSTYKAEEVFLAVGITVILCLGLTIFAMQTKYDFTVCGGMILVSLLCLIIFGIVAAIWQNHIVDMLYASVGALLACFFLIYDTQLMIGGDHKYSISPEEYIFAALNLYMDVVRIFIYILRLIGGRK